MCEALRHDLRQPEFSEGYAESFLDSFVATQLKVLREQNGWSQTQLAERMGKKQTVISRSERVNYSSWSISTLKQYARAFRLRLRVSFETYGSLIDEAANFSEENLRRTPRESDLVLNGVAAGLAAHKPIQLVPMPEARTDASPFPYGNASLVSLAQGMGSLSGNNSTQTVPPWVRVPVGSAGSASSQASVLERSA
jgi:transcriptional regulator with XRE-family HTH domain